MAETVDDDGWVTQKRDDALRRALNTPPKPKTNQNAGEATPSTSPAKARKPAQAASES